MAAGHAVMSVRDRHDLAVLFAHREYTRGVEVGVADGRYSLILCESIPRLELGCVDPWDTYSLNSRGGGQKQQHGNYELAKERLAPYNATLIRKLSMEAVLDFEDESLDFVYLDANHDFDFIMSDLIEWTPKVRQGGVVAGHDYYHFTNSGVIEAVDAYAAAHSITFEITREREPSFWWTR